jgi:hypothetical protein
MARIAARIKLALLAMACLFPSLLPAQRLTKHELFLGGMGGMATLSGDGAAVVTPSSASTSLLDPMNGGAADVFFGIHLSSYVSLQADYVWNRNDLVLVSMSNSSGSSSFFKQPETVTQNAILGNLLVYFRKRSSRIRPYLSEGVGVVLFHSQRSSGGVSSGHLTLPPSSADHASPALRTSVGLDVRLRRLWYFRYSFGETITRNMLGNQVSPAEHRIPKNFQNLFGLYFQF